MKKTSLLFLFGFLAVSQVFGATFSSLLRGNTATIGILDSDPKGLVFVIDDAMIKAKIKPSSHKLGDLYEFGDQGKIAIQQRDDSGRELQVTWTLPGKEDSIGYRFVSSVEDTGTSGFVSLNYDAAENLFLLLKKAGHKPIFTDDGVKAENTIKPHRSLSRTRTFFHGATGPSFQCDLSFPLTKEDK